MKVVRPEWLTDSVKAGVLLPWTDFIFRPVERVEDSQGAKTAQKSLLDGFVSQTQSRASNNPMNQLSSTEATYNYPDPINDVNMVEEASDPLATTSLPQEVSDRQISSSSRPKDKMPASPRSLYTTDPTTLAEASLVPGYAAHVSNSMAERVMANPEWRSAHTSVAPDFIEGFYKNSRLHHLSTWKAELKNLVAEAQERADRGVENTIASVSEGADEAVRGISSEFCQEGIAPNAVSMRGAELVMRSPSKGKGKGKAKADEDDKVIMHCDFDCFFVSAGLVNRPHLRGKPVVVCHSQGAQGGNASTSEIASSSYEARKFGIKNGMRCVNTGHQRLACVLMCWAVFNKLANSVLQY